MNGPDPAALEQAQARLKNAQDQAEAARSNLVNLQLKAPIAGTVTQVNTHSGEWVIPGQPVLSLADLDHLRIETTDLSERDVPKIEIGQPVTILVEALDQNVAGHVIQIAPLADTLGGDVVYKTTIDLDKPTPGLRAGMSVEVQFETGQ
jgi:multidrug resistance efflux pump